MFLLTQIKVYQWSVMLELELYDVEYDAIRKENGPVNEPSHHTVKRDLVLAEWGKKGLDRCTYILEKRMIGK